MLKCHLGNSHYRYFHQILISFSSAGSCIFVSFFIFHYSLIYVVDIASTNV